MGDDTGTQNSGKSIVAQAMERIRKMFVKVPPWEEACPTFAIAIDHLDQEITEQGVETRTKLEDIHTDVKKTNGHGDSTVTWSSPLGPVRFPSIKDMFKFALGAMILSSVWNSSCSVDKSKEVVLAEVAETKSALSNVVVRVVEIQRLAVNQFHATHNNEGRRHCQVCTEEGHPH